jgi:hypothetical protein
MAKWRGSKQHMHAALDEGMQAGLDAVHQSVPPYPSPPPRSKYKRTGNLGRSMGSSMGGGAHGAPDIRTVKHGANFVEGRFGSSLGYSEYVIGQGSQAGVHVGRWWTNATLASKAYERVQSAFRAVMDKFAAWMSK